MLTTATQDIFVGRQPILDRQGRIRAYELLFRSGGQNLASIPDDVTATARVLATVFGELGLEMALGDALGFVNVNEAMLMHDVLEMLPANKIVIELLETVEGTPAVVERCYQLRQRGFTIALDDVLEARPDLRPLFGVASIIKIDVSATPADHLEPLVEELQQFPVSLLAEKVDTEAMSQLCTELGFDLFQGYYFARPTILRGKKLSASQTTLLRLLGLILSDADTSDIEALFKQDASLLLNLMRLTNSLGGGGNGRISTLRQAITMIGRRQLQRWLQLLLFCNNSGQMDSPLLVTAATRARCMELLASRLGGGAISPDSAFMAGILSLMPALLGLPLDEIVAQMPLPEILRNALLERSGLLGSLLGMIEAHESLDETAMRTRLKLLAPLNLQDVNIATAQAMSWSASLISQ